MTQRKKPTKEPRVNASTRVQEWLKKELDARAEREGRTVSQVIERMLLAQVEAEGKRRK